MIKLSHSCILNVDEAKQNNTLIFNVNIQEVSHEPFSTEKRKWNSYPNKTFKTFKVYEIILNKGAGKYDKKLP